MKNLILILFLFIGFNATAQLNLDSLNHVWLEETQPDSSRFKAIESIIWDGLLFKRPDTAFILLQEFKKFAQEKENKKWEARALGIMGVYFINQGNFSLALEHDLKSLKIYEEIGFKEGIGHSYNDIGVIYKNLGNPDKALEYFTQALEIRLDIGVMTNIPSSYNNIGVIHSIQGNNLEAIKFFKKGIDLAEEIGEDEEMINPLYNVADEYYIIGDTIKALEHMYQSLQISEKLNYKGGIASAFKFLGRVYFDQRNIPKAIEFATNSLNLAREIDYIWEIRHAAGLLKDIYEFQKLGLQALEMYELEIQMRDSLNSEDAKKGLIQMEVEHEYEKKELLAEQEHQQEIFKKNETRNYLIAGVSLALLFSIGILSRLRFVRRTNGALELAKNRAEKSEQFKQQFLANMSHEIRTPMHAISGMVKILKRKEHPTNQDTYLNAMHTSSDNLLVILNDVLDLSKIEVGKLDIESIPVKPAAIVENVMQILKFKAEEKGLILSANIEKDVPSLVMGDPTRLNQILINLIGNSIKFTAKGSVNVLLTKIEDNLRISITDTGIGIPKNQIDKIFGAFEQAEESTSRSYGGTGLGLSITQQLTELQNGKIWVESEEGKGSTFFVELPIIATVGGATGKELITEDNLKSRAAALNGTRILLVEDNAFNQMIAQDDLNYYIEDVKIDTVENGLLAVEKYQANDYDLILMDVQMPLMNGFEATQKIRDLEKSAGKENKMPIIAMTASLLKSEVDNCLAAGMNNYIPKPYQPKELIGPIYEVLKKNTIA